MPIALPWLISTASSYLVAVVLFTVVGSMNAKQVILLGIIFFFANLVIWLPVLLAIRRFAKLNFASVLFSSLISCGLAFSGLIFLVFLFLSSPTTEIERDLEANAIQRSSTSYSVEGWERTAAIVIGVWSFNAIVFSKASGIPLTSSPSRRRKRRDLS